MQNFLGIHYIIGVYPHFLSLSQTNVIPINAPLANAAMYKYEIIASRIKFENINAPSSTVYQILHVKV